MAERSNIDQLDDALNALLAGQELDQQVDPSLQELIEVARELRGLPRDEFRQQLRNELIRSNKMSSPSMKTEKLDEFSQQQPKDAASTTQKPRYRREGFHTVTPYLTVQQPAELLEFLKQSFLATELGRTTGSAGGMHAEVRIGDSMLMVGGGVGLKQMPTAIHLYVSDVDEAYQRAIDAGATSLFEPADQPYGERSGAVQDPFGNRWYIATPDMPLREIDKDLHTVTLYLHPIGAQQLIDFVSDAFGAEEVMRNQTPDGMILHAKLRFGNSIIELGESRSGSLPMPTAIYMYVEDVDALYERALKAGCKSVLPPSDQPYGDRNAWVTDPFNNIWYLATRFVDDET